MGLKAVQWKVSARVHGVTNEAAHGPQIIFSGTKKECMKFAKIWMKDNPPQNELDSIQLTPFDKNNQRAWGTYSVRWNAGRKKWVKGEGIR